MFFGLSKSSQIKELRESLDRAKESLNERINNVRETLRDHGNRIVMLRNDYFTLRNDYAMLRTEFDELQKLLSPTVEALRKEQEQRILEMNREMAQQFKQSLKFYTVPKERVPLPSRTFNLSREDVTQRAKYENDERTNPTPRDWDTIASSFFSDDTHRSSSSCDSSSSSSYSSSCDSSSYSSSSDSGSSSCD